ncbi:tetratricopeptide repeat protein [Amycolatopsis lurida]
MLIEAGWTGDKLARTVNALGAEAGIRLRYQRASVGQWLTGVHPRAPVPDLVAEAFSRSLGRPVTVEETGLAPGDWPEGAEPAGWRLDNTMNSLVELGSGAMSRAALAHYVYRAADLSVPGWRELTAEGQDQPDDSPSATVERGEIGSVNVMTRLFSDADAAFGGGQVRRAAASYLTFSVVPLLRASASPATRRNLLTSAARLSYLCGFLCFDDELHGVAQRYYLASLRLAAEAGDNVGYGIALRALSVQARLLGHNQRALALAEAAVRATSRAAPAQTRAFLLGQLAVADAATGDQRAAATHLIAAEQHLERAGNPTDPVGAYHSSSLAHQHAAVSACSGDRRAAVVALQESIRHRPVGERRSRAITLARLAELQIRDGRLDQACDTWDSFLNDYPHLRSRRADTAFATLRANIRTHQKSPTVRALSQRVAVMATTTHDHG